jgi:hypothetical protein
MPKMQGVNIISSIGITRTFASFGIMTSIRKQISCNALGACTLHPHFFSYSFANKILTRPLLPFWTRTKQNKLSIYGLAFYARHKN